MGLQTSAVEGALHCNVDGQCSSTRAVAKERNVAFQRTLCVHRVQGPNTQA
jgi:hypothetical protein